MTEKSDSIEQNPSETIRLLRSAAQGDESGWCEIQDRHRDRLHRLVDTRMDRRMRARVDASDVVQDAFLEAWKNIDKYLDQPKMPFYLWLRAITGHKLIALHRFHLGTEMRNAKREISMYGGAVPETTCADLAAHLAKEQTRASEVAMRGEFEAQLNSALENLDPIDCEILTLRHFEQLTNSEVARVLEIEPSAASKRYIRALQRLRDSVSFNFSEYDNRGIE
ncbi:RNA polymerase sigma factor [Vicingaceae bacterium]|nr:RNA polymerase sigma factor [Vicingaceae bacterium]